MSAFGGIIALFFGAIFFLPHLDDMPGPAKLFFAVWFLVVIGGIIPDIDIPKLKEMGVRGIFLPGTPMQEIIDFINARQSGGV